MDGLLEAKKHKGLPTNNSRELCECKSNRRIGMGKCKSARTHLSLNSQIIYHECVYKCKVIVSIVSAVVKPNTNYESRISCVR